MAVVSDSEQVRLSAARAFDAAPSGWSMTFEQGPEVEADVVVTPAGSTTPGDVMFDPSDPARLVEDIRRFLSPAGGRVVVISASGGAGVTSLVLHLAAAFAGPHGEAFVVEASPSCGTVERLGLGRDEVPTWEGIGADVSGHVTALPRGLRLLAAPQEPGPCIGAATAATSSGRMVVVDGRPGVVDELGPQEGPVVAVTPPTVPGAQRTRGLAATRPDLEWAIVTNRLGRGGETTPGRLTELLGAEPALALPCTPSLRDAEDLGALLHPRRTRYARRVALLADALRRR